MKKKEENKKRKTACRQELETIKIHSKTCPKQNTVELHIEQLNLKKDNIKKAFKEYNDAINEIKNKELDLQENIKKIKGVLAENEAIRMEIQKKIEETSLALAKMQDVQAKLLEEQSLVNVKYSTIQERNDNIIENVQRIKGESKLYNDKNNLKNPLLAFLSRFPKRD